MPLTLIIDHVSRTVSTTAFSYLHLNRSRPFGWFFWPFLHVPKLSATTKQIKLCLVILKSL